jgi:hypothetical protein
LMADFRGVGASYASAAIADFLTGSTVTSLKDYKGVSRSLPTVFSQAKSKQLARIDGSSATIVYKCTQKGIRADGGIPEELRRVCPSVLTFLSSVTLLFFSSRALPAVLERIFVRTIHRTAPRIDTSHC